jgi:site-specific recombinase XerC
MADDTPKTFEELLTPNTTLTMNSETIAKLKAQGKITERFITFEEHLEKMFEDILAGKDTANELIQLLPRLHPEVGSSVIVSMFQELERLFVLEFHSQSIDHATKMLEQAAKYRLWEEKLKVNPNAGWSAIEGLLLGQAIDELDKYGVLSADEYKELKTINKEVRNAYAHTKILELIKRHGLILEELPSMNVETEEIVIQKNVVAAENPILWAMAKRVLDRDTFVPRVQECMNWVNYLLMKPLASEEERNPRQEA